MATQKDLARRLRTATTAERAAHAANRAANAEVAAAVAKLPPHYVDNAEARRLRLEAAPLVERAQRASDKWFAVHADYVNAREAAAGHVSSSGRRSQKGSARVGVMLGLALAGGAAFFGLQRGRR